MEAAGSGTEMRQRTFTIQLEIWHTISQFVKRIGTRRIVDLTWRLKDKQTMFYGLLVLVWLLSVVIGVNVLYARKVLPFSDFSYPLEMDFISMFNDFKKHGKPPSNIEPINPHPFHYIHLKQKCDFKSDKGVSLLILVKSAVNHFHLRDGIRATWGKVNEENIQIVYLLAYRPEHQLQIDEEAAKYGDIIQQSFIDAYRNNTYKTIMGFSWAVRYCSQASHILFVDDDHYLVLPNILLYLRRLYNANMDNFMVGYAFIEPEPKRSMLSKWCVSFEEYPFDTYPTYVTAGTFVVSRDVAYKMVFAFPYVKYFWVDDVYLSIVSHKLGVIPQHDPRFYQPSYLLHTEPTHMVYHDFKTKEAFINAEKFLRGFPLVSPASKMCRYSWRCLASLLL